VTLIPLQCTTQKQRKNKYNKKNVVDHSTQKPLKTTMLKNGSVKAEPEEESEFSFQQPNNSFAQAIARKNNGAQSSEAPKRGKEVRLLCWIYCIIESLRGIITSLLCLCIIKLLRLPFVCIILLSRCALFHGSIILHCRIVQVASTNCCIDQLLYLPIVALTNSFAFILSHSFSLTSNVTPFLLVLKL